MKRTTEACKLKTDYLPVTRIVAENNCINSCAVLEDSPRQTVLYGKETSLTLKNKGWIILDFGKELQGGVTITLPEIKKNTSLRIVFGESVSEAMSDIGYKNATNDHSVRDIIMPISGWQTFRYGNTGFRFVKLEAVDNDVSISNIQAVFEYRDIEYVGSFECDDKLLNQIWQVGAYTVHLNMQEYLWDGIKRDRLVWIGDMHPEVSTILSVFGENEIIQKSLDLISKYVPSSDWISGIPSYNLWWIIIQHDYYIRTGNIEYLNQNKSYLCDICRHFLSEINSDGTHNIEGMFVEWSSNETQYAQAGFQALMVIGLKSAAEICRICGENALSEKCLAASELMKKIVYPYEGNKQIAAMISLAEMADSKEISNTVLKPNGAEGLSTFWGFYTLKALAKSGDMDSALNIIRDYWGKMIEMGATSFWEDFDIKWTENADGIDKAVAEGKDDIHGDFGSFCYTGLRHSLCHGWASGPTAFLSEYVLGVKIDEPGCKAVSIRPHMGDLKWVKGSYPTPYGKIYVEHQVKNGKTETTVSGPKEIEFRTES